MTEFEDMFVMEQKVSTTYPKGSHSDKLQNLLSGNQKTSLVWEAIDFWELYSFSETRLNGYIGL
jgi:hypothetical protein